MASTQPPAYRRAGGTRPPPLWRCPRCGRLFVTRNIYHGCGPYTVAGFLKRKGPRARALYRGFVALLRRCGPVIAAPTKTRVAFMVRVRFAGISALSERGMTVAFALTRPLASPGAAHRPLQPEVVWTLPAD